MSRFLRASVLLALTTAQAARAEQGAPGPTPPAPETTVVVTGASDTAFPEIAVDFEVRRPDGSFLLDARADDFRVTEEGQPVKVIRFEAPESREARPTTVVLVVDRSGSMGKDDRIGALKRAVASFLEGLPEGSRVAVVAFGSEVTTLCPFTTDFGRVRVSVNRLSAFGATRYFDGVAEALDLLAEEPGRRAVLALTDGLDTSSERADLDSVILSARRLGLPVHTLGLGGDEATGAESLQRLATSTRGQAYSAARPEQLRGIYEEMAQRLRSSYTLAYLTDRKIPDGTLRPVRVVYRESQSAGETALFIPGMVAPATGWSPLFVGLVSGLVALRRFGRRGGATVA